MNEALTLPPADAETLAHSHQVLHSLRDLISHAGKIDFPTFLQHVLYAPTLGYYTSGMQKFGAKGDFVTAPEISPLFSCALANHCAQVLSTCTHPTILELGPGTGRMAADMLSYLETIDSLPEHYYCLELSPDLRARQRETITTQCPHLINRVTWLNELPHSPINGIIVANEVLDAMPVHAFLIGPNGLEERFITLTDNQLQWHHATPSLTLTNAITPIIQSCDIQAPYLSEINCHLTPFVNSLSDCLHHGMITFIDYGFLRPEYYHPQRNTGTLMCHYQHRNHSDPFFMPGCQDITTHVDFTSLIEAADACDLTVAHYDTQANFLLRHDIAGLCELLTKKYPEKQLHLSQQCQTLLFPHEMGELFKVISLVKNRSDTQSNDI